MTSTAAPTAAPTAAQRSESLDARASDTSIISQYPTGLVRLLVLLSPFISLTTRFIQLATWTAGPGTASHSFLLVLAWWAICLYGYEIVRYAPQAVLLAVIVFSGLGRAFQGVKRGSNVGKGQAVSSESINVTIENLSTLADFFSTVSNTLIGPLWSLLTWQSFEHTKAATIFLITTWPIWILCFASQAWDMVGLPRIALGLRRHALHLVALLAPTLRNRLGTSLEWAKQQWPRVFERGEEVQGYMDRVATFTEAHILPSLRFLVSSLTGLASSSSSPSLRLTLLPPFPLFSLSVRHILFVLGTLSLTWCSPWCALIRHALWRSALVRQTTRKTVALLCGRRPSLLYPPPSTAGQQSSPSQVFEKNPFDEEPRAETALKTEDRSGNNVTRHEDVIYQFTILENQRWWMGLDWTAALLPQERPSWSDESNNPVSPPSSFSLPPPKTTLKPAPTSLNPKAYVKRLVRWQWIDAEWIVAGREGGGGLEPVSKKSRRQSSTSSTTASSGTLFSNSTTTTGGRPSEEMSESQAGQTSSTKVTAGASNELPSDLQWLAVDAEGWQYGDNSWEKMSRKSGLGRYTRRRRWIRRAVLVEVVQRNYLPSEEELRPEGDEEEGKPPQRGASAKPPSLPSSPSSPSSPRTTGGGDLKQRLARAAQGSSSSEA